MKSEVYGQLMAKLTSDCSCTFRIITGSLN